MQSGQGIETAQDREALLLSHARTAAGTDAQLVALLRRAHAMTLQQSQRLEAIGQSIDEAVARNSGPAALTTPAEVQEFQQFLVDRQKAIMAVVKDARAAAGELAKQVQELAGYAPPASPAPGGSGGDAGSAEGPPVMSRGALDGVHGTGDRSMPVVLRPGELGPYGYSEAVPGTGIWVPQDEISGQLQIVPQGQLAPAGHTQIGTAPDGSGLWWPTPPTNTHE